MIRMCIAKPFRIERYCYLPCMILLSLVSAVLLAEQLQAPPPPDQDPFVGQWQADGDASRPKLNREDRAYTRTIGRERDEVIFSATIGKSKPTVRQYRIRCDGLFHRLPVGALQSCIYVSPNRVEGESRDSANPRYWVREVSPDGQLMTIWEYRDKARTKLKSTFVLKRVN